MGRLQRIVSWALVVATVLVSGSARSADQPIHPRRVVGRFCGAHSVLGTKIWGGVVRLGETTVVTAAHLVHHWAWTARPLGGIPGFAHVEFLHHADRRDVRGESAVRPIKGIAFPTLNSDRAFPDIAVLRIGANQASSRLHQEGVNASPGDVAVAKIAPMENLPRGFVKITTDTRGRMAFDACAGSTAQARSVPGLLIGYPGGRHAEVDVWIRSEARTTVNRTNRGTALVADGRTWPGTSGGGLFIPGYSKPALSGVLSWGNQQTGVLLLTSIEELSKSFLGVSLVGGYLDEARLPPDLFSTPRELLHQFPVYPKPCRQACDRRSRISALVWRTGPS